MSAKKNDLVAMVEHLAESGEVLNKLLQMPQERLDQVLHLLSDPNAVATLRRLLRTVRGIQGESRVKSRVAGKKASRHMEAEEFEAALHELFSDKTQFPTVSSIAEFSDSIFGVNVPYAKSSRDRYIRRVVRAVTASPKALYNARNALERSEITQKDEAYNLLYKFIRGRLSE